MSHGADDAFWAQNNILANPSRYKDIPVYLVGGWYDSWAGNTTAKVNVSTSRKRALLSLLDFIAGRGYARSRRAVSRVSKNLLRVVNFVICGYFNRCLRVCLWSLT